MDRRQQGVLAAALFLLTAGLLFPYTAYPVGVETPEGRRVQIEYRLVPVWQTLVALRGQPSPNPPPGYPAIDGQAMSLFAATVILGSGWPVDRLGRDRKRKLPRRPDGRARRGGTGPEGRRPGMPRTVKVGPE